jgi:hypothetical protein
MRGTPGIAARCSTRSRGGVNVEAIAQGCRVQSHSPSRSTTAWPRYRALHAVVAAAMKARSSTRRATGPASVAPQPRIRLPRRGVGRSGDVSSPASRRGITLEGRRSRTPEIPPATRRRGAACVLETRTEAGIRSLPGLSLRAEEGRRSRAGSALGLVARGLRSRARAGHLRQAALRAVLVGERGRRSWHSDNVPFALGGLLRAVPRTTEAPRCRWRSPVQNLRLVLVHPSWGCPAESRGASQEIPVGVHVAQSAALARLVALFPRISASWARPSTPTISWSRSGPRSFAATRRDQALRKAGALGVALAGAGPSSSPSRATRAPPGPAAGVEGFGLASVEATSRVHLVDNLGARSIDR